MNSNVMPSRVQMEPNLLQQLVAEVKETVATNVNARQPIKTNAFRAIDMWNIRKNGRYANTGNKRKKNTTLSVTHVSF